MTTTASEYSLYPKAKPTGELPPKILERLDERYLNVGEVDTKPKSGSAGISVTDHGAVAGIATTQTPAFQAAIDAAVTAGLPVLVPPGTYRMLGYLSLPAGTQLQMHPDTVLDFSKSSANNYLIIQGATGTSVQAPTVVKGTWTMPLSGSTLTAGDWVLLRSEDVFDSASTSTTQGELIQVAKAEAGQITFRTTVCDTYRTNVSLTPITMVRNITIRGGTIRGSADITGSKGGIRAEYAEDLRLDGVRFERIDRAMIYIKNSVNAWVTHCALEWAETDSMGYGVSFGDATRDSGCMFSTFRAVRHSLSTNNTLTAGVGGIVRRILFFGNTIDDSLPALGGSQMGGDAIDTHTASEDIWIIQNSVNKATGKGINMECASGVISGNTVQDTVGHAIDFHNESDRSGSVTITGNVVRRAGVHGISARAGSRGTTSPMESATITGNRVEGAGETGIQLGYTVIDRGTVVTSNSVSDAPRAGIRITRQAGAVVHGNTVSRCGGIGIEYDQVRGSTLGPDSINAGAPTGAWVGVKAANVTRSKITPGAVTVEDPDGVGVEIGSSCANIALGPTAHLDAPTQLVNNGPSSVRSY